MAAERVPASRFTEALQQRFAVGTQEERLAGDAALAQRLDQPRYLGEVLGPIARVDTDRGRFVRLVFEAQSALGTVGLSMNMSGELTPAGRLLIVALMFIGRVGPLALLESMARRSRRKQPYRLGREDILVG